MSSLNAPWPRLHTPQPVMCLREDAAAGHPRRLSTRSAGPGTPNSLAGHPRRLSTRSAGPGTPDTSPHALPDRAPPTPLHTLCWTGHPQLLGQAPPMPLHMLCWTGHPQLLGRAPPTSLHMLCWTGHPRHLSTCSVGSGERPRPAYPAPCMFSTWLRLDSITEVKASSSSTRNPLHMLQIFFRATNAYSRMLKLWLKHHCSTTIRACFRISFWKERIILHM